MNVHQLDHNARTRTINAQNLYIILESHSHPPARPESNPIHILLSVLVYCFIVIIPIDICTTENNTFFLRASSVYDQNVSYIVKCTSTDNIELLNAIFTPNAVNQSMSQNIIFIYNIFFIIILPIRTFQIKIY